MATVLATPSLGWIGLHFDYINQAWTQDGKYIRCGHPENMKCGCFGRVHEGEDATEVLTVQAQEASEWQKEYGL